MSKKYFINPGQAVVAGLTTFFCFAIMIGMLVSPRHLIIALIFLIFGLLFLKQFLDSAGIITVDQKGITRRLLFAPKIQLPWEQIAEVGIAGENVFKRKKSNRVGTLYFYFSTEELDDDKRFQMMVKWPPKDKIYMTWNKKKMKTVKSCFHGGFVKYNTGNRII